MIRNTRRRTRGVVPTTAILSVLQPLALTKRDRALGVEVRRGEELLGTLELGQGSLLWKPAAARTTYTMRWRRFGTVMKQCGRPIKSQDRA